MNGRLGREGRGSEGEEIHQPAEKDGPADHDQEEKEPIPGPGLLVVAPEEGEDDGDEEGLQDHRQEMAAEDHDFFPAAMSQASRQMR
jgi:hypothetical protein